MKGSGYDIKLSLEDSISFELLEQIAIEKIGTTTNIICTPNGQKIKIK
jgi:hypothetical protein